MACSVYDLSQATSAVSRLPGIVAEVRPEASPSSATRRWSQVAHRITGRRLMRLCHPRKAAALSGGFPARRMAIRTARACLPRWVSAWTRIAAMGRSDLEVRSATKYGQ